MNAASIMTNQSLPTELKTLEVNLLELGESNYPQFVKHNNAALQTTNATLPQPFRDTLIDTADRSTLYGTLVPLRNRVAPLRLQ